MTTRVTLIAPAVGPDLREARFIGSGVVSDGAAGVRSDEEGKDEGLDATGLRQAEAARADAWDTCLPHSADPAGRRLYVSPTRRCRHTAEALGIDARPLSVLAPCAAGRWQGRTLDEVAAAEPESVGTWLADPRSAPHGGETLADLHLRVGAWLDGLAAEAAGRVVAVAEPDVMRAAAVHALGAEPQVFWRLDVRPLSVTELSGRNGRWNLLSGRPLRGSAP
jgi:broad specificity phosphatase PhoE